MIDTLVGVVGVAAVVEVGRTYHVPVCVGQMEQVGGGGYLLWRALAAEVTGQRGDG